MDAAVVANIISFLAFGVSSYALWITRKFNARQEELVKLQTHLSRIELDRIESDAQTRRRAVLTASLVATGKGHKLVLSNLGPAVARNVRLEFDERNGILIRSDCDSKLPWKALECSESITFIARVHLGMDTKHAITVFWDDDSGMNNNKELVIAI